MCESVLYEVAVPRSGVDGVEGVEGFVTAPSQAAGYLSGDQRATVTITGRLSWRVSHTS